MLMRNHYYSHNAHSVRKPENMVSWVSQSSSPTILALMALWFLG